MTASNPAATISLAGHAGRRRRERVVGAIFFGSALVTILITAFILYTVVFEALKFLGIIDLSALIADGWFPRRGMFDIATLVVGTFVVAAIAMLVAGPLCLLAAIYLSEYADSRARKLIKPVIEVLAGIPSVVLGVFALTFISPELVQRLFTDAAGFNLLAAGIGVGILIIPIVASISEDARSSWKTDAAPVRRAAREGPVHGDRGRGCCCRRHRAGPSKTCRVRRTKASPTTFRRNVIAKSRNPRENRLSKAPSLPRPYDASRRAFGTARMAMMSAATMPRDRGRKDDPKGRRDPRTWSEPVASAAIAAVIVCPGPSGSIVNSEPPTPPAAIATTMVSPTAREMLASLTFMPLAVSRAGR